MRRTTLTAALCILATLSATVAAEEHEHLVPSISVVGQGEVQIKPDTAHVQVGVTTEAEKASDALHENSQRMGELFNTLKQHDIAEKHVQTSGFNVTPIQTYDRNRDEPPRIVGYRVTNQVRVTVVEPQRLGAILDAVVQAGGNQIQGVTFSISNPEPHLDEARRLAMSDARRRARLYAIEAGVALGHPLIISEQSIAVPQPKRFAEGVRAAAMRADVPIAEGEQTLSASIHVTYAIKGMIPNS